MRAAVPRITVIPTVQERYHLPKLLVWNFVSYYSDNKHFDWSASLKIAHLNIIVFSKISFSSTIISRLILSSQCWRKYYSVCCLDPKHHCFLFYHCIRIDAFLHMNLAMRNLLKPMLTTKAYIYLHLVLCCLDTNIYIPLLYIHMEKVKEHFKPYF